jgi:hypothetical protein
MTATKKGRGQRGIKIFGGQKKKYSTKKKIFDQKKKKKKLCEKPQAFMI